MADGGGAREGGDFGEGDAGGVGKGVGECPEAGAENQADFRAEWGVLQDELGGGFG